MRDFGVIPVERLDFRFSPRPWHYAQANRAKIDAHFAAKRRVKPALWNGRVLLACEHSVTDGTCHGAFLETDFASFDAWRDWGCPPAAAMDCFAAAVLRAGDGAYLLGVMNGHTTNAGRIYFPCGTPDLGDIVDGRVDLERNARREFEEETGLNFDKLDADPGWLVVIDGPLIMHAKLLRAAEPAAELRQRILRHLALQQQPELADVRIVRGSADLDPMMPPFVSAFLRHLWR